jgi:hypothetical protein
MSQILVALEDRRSAGQRLHAAVAGVAGRVCHLLAAFQCAEEGAADAEGEGRLFEFVFGLLAAGFAGLNDIHLLGQDGDVACGSDHAAADLSVGFAGLQGDVAGDAAHGAGGGAGALRLLLGGSLLRANADAAAVIEQAVLFSCLERGRAAGVGGGLDAEVVAGHQSGGGITHHAGAFDIDVSTRHHGDGVAAQG